MERLPLLVTNLLNDVDGLGSLLDDAVGAGCWLDAYLVAAGMNQIAEDRLHAAPYPFDEAASFLNGSRSRGARLLGEAAAVCGRTSRALAGSRPGSRRLALWQRRLGGTVDDLAEVVAGARTPDSDLGGRCRAIVDDIAGLPDALRGAIVRLPACFHGFDQAPQDLGTLAERYGESASDRPGPLLVVGLRTSGSYLAPLLAAFLRAQGRPTVHAITLRPRHALLSQERALIAASLRAGGDVLLTDDPPVTGGSLVQAARVLERCGVAPESIVVCLGLIGERPPPSLDGYRTVLLGRSEWAIDPRLRADRVRVTLGSLLSGELEVHGLDPLALPGSRSARGHRRSLWRVTGRDLRNGATRQLDVLVSGVGLGYFGGQALAVANVLSVFSPRVLGLRDGLLYREWLAPERGIDRSGPASDELVAGAARYIAARRAALPLARDPSMALRGARPAWEVAGMILSDGFGRGSPVARVVFVDALARRLLSVARPSVVDGATEPRRWFAGEREGDPILKAGLTDHTHWRLGLACSDAAFDLAGVGALSPHRHDADAVRRAWWRVTGEEVPPERWLLYELAHLWGTQLADPRREADVRHAAARALQRYFAGVFLTGLPPPDRGKLVALDIDGVLETDVMGWPSLSRASATALRALLAHGYRPVPVSGRGLDEVRDRCHAYGLAGAVAEYGCVAYLTRTDRAIPLVQACDVAALDRLRDVLQEAGDVKLDPAYRHSLRAYRLGRQGRRHPVGEDEVCSALSRAAALGILNAIPGESQTDFIPSALDKGRGLAALAAELDGKPPKVALAVGDSLPDLPMLRLAEIAYVPAHAPAETTNRSVKRAGKAYQAGLELAVADLLGHRPGDCERCLAPRLDFAQTAVVGLLSIAEGGRRHIPGETVRLLSRLLIASVRRR